MYVCMYLCMYVQKIYKFDVSICVLRTCPFLTMESISTCIRTFYNKLKIDAKNLNMAQQNVIMECVRHPELFCIHGKTKSPC